MTWLLKGIEIIQDKGDEGDLAAPTGRGVEDDDHTTPAKGISGRA